MKTLLPYLKEYKKQAILGSMFKLFEAILEVMVPLVMAKIIDNGVANNDSNYIIKMGGILLLLAAVGLSSAFCCQYLASRASQGVGTRIRNDLFAHINSLSHSEIDKIGAPSLITRITNDVNQVQVGIAMLIRLASRVPFIICGSIVMAMILDLRLSIIFLVETPLIGLVLYLVMSKSVPYFKKIQTKVDRISLITRESLDGIRSIKAFSKEQHEIDKFNKSSNELSEESIKVGKISALLNPVTFIIMNFSIIAVLWYGGLRINFGSLSQGEIIAFVNYITQILLALIVLSNLVVTFNKAIASSDRIEEIFKLKSSIIEGDSTNYGDLKTHIEFKNVSFYFNSDAEKAISNISFKINRGETIGIIGGTGAGKSTLVNLIPRFYDATSGEIIINGINVKDYTFDTLRNPIGIVPQKSVLFSGSIRDNLKWGKENATDEELFEALHIAQGLEFVQKLPDGLDTILSQGGKNLSGGQKQRLTIARALVSKPEILILDDSASALDFVTDAKLRQALSEKTKDTTVLMVSQRASTIMNSDKIIVLDNGILCGIGTHKELLDSCSVYKEICLSQLSSEEVQ
ncbi:MAG: ABC transporter ATP-binding protein [Clostridiaceae bacterium]|nr:ABC transporter ATP-binding protein [Clostridiaceae bacterium]